MWDVGECVCNGGGERCSASSAWYMDNGSSSWRVGSTWDGDSASSVWSGGGRATVAVVMLYFLAVLLFLPSPGEGVVGVVMGGGNSSYCRWDVPKDLLYFGYSVCLSLSPAYLAANRANRESSQENMTDFDLVIFSFNVGGDIMMGGVTESWHLRVMYRGWSYIFDDRLLPGTWRTLCFKYGHDGSTMKVYIREREGVVLKSVASESYTNGTEEVPLGFCLGSPVEGRRSFAGTILAVSVTPTDASAHQGSELGWTDCTSFKPLNDIIHIDSSWNSSGEVNLINYDDEKLCDDFYTQVAVKFVGGHDIMLKKCQMLGGRLPSRSEIQAGFFRMSTALSETCNTTGMFVTWLGSVRTESDIILWSKCSVLHRDGSIGTRYCISELDCTVCLVPHAVQFTLYGIIHNMDRVYTLRSSPEIYLKGDGASEIIYINNSWILRSSLHAHKLVLEGTSLPVGRHRWGTMEDGGLLTLTPCGEAQFSCDDGSCVPRSQKCDGIEHCLDHSDEAYCNLMRANGYNKYVSPAKSIGSIKVNDVERLDKLTFAIDVHSIGPITTINGVATIQMSFVFEWYENRMKYWELTDESNFIDCKAIWVPEMRVMAGYFQGMGYDLDVYHTGCYVEKLQGIPQHRDMEDPNMGQYFNGWEQPLKYEMKFRMTIPCNFKLHRYPFGSHVCPGTFYMLNSGQPSMVFQSASNSNSVNYSGTHDLIEYKLLDITYLNDAENIVVKLHLKSLYDYHVLNSFVPSAIVFLIALTTLFFPLSNFNERIMVSLTVLVVLAALFTQASSASVKTPYFKLLDVWYTSLVALCFSAVVINTIAHAILNNYDNVGMVVPMGRTHRIQEKRKRRMASRFNACAIITLFTIFFCLVGTCVLFAADGI